MTKEEFNERWNKFFTAFGLKGLLYKKPHRNNKTRYENFLEQSKKSYKKNYKPRVHKIRYHKRPKICWEEEYNRLLLEAMRQRVQDQKILLENDEPTRAMEELARFTPEERKAYDEWEKEHTAC